MTYCGFEPVFSEPVGRLPRYSIIKNVRSMTTCHESLSPIGQVLAKRQDLEVGHTWMGLPVGSLSQSFV